MPSPWSRVSASVPNRDAFHGPRGQVAPRQQRGADPLTRTDRGKGRRAGISPVCSGGPQGTVSKRVKAGAAANLSNWSVQPVATACNPWRAGVRKLEVWESAVAIRERDAVASRPKAHAPVWKPATLSVACNGLSPTLAANQFNIGLKCEIDLAGSFVTHTARGFILFELSGIRPS